MSVVPVEIRMLIQGTGDGSVLFRFFFASPTRQKIHGRSGQKQVIMGIRKRRTICRYANTDQNEMMQSG